MQGSAHPRYIQPKCQLLHKGEEEETRIGDEGSALSWRRSTCWPAAPLSCGTAWDRSLRGGGVDTGRGKEQEGGIFFLYNWLGPHSVSAHESAIFGRYDNQYYTFLPIILS
jgi:hypothetical protein